MSVLTKELLKAVQAAEQAGIDEKAEYRLKFHLMPPVGWLNDPNGLCQAGGEYHVFFQYTPFDPKGGLKVWGHYVSRDLLHWKYLGTPILPDEAWDCHGAYSGSALVEEGKINLFYTGNVKYPGDYDYIEAGRGSNTILVESADGRTFSKKQCILSNTDYPENYTNHIRDPKVWKEGNLYYMVLGGRRKGDTGAVLVYKSEDKIHWNLKNEIAIEDKFAYMWECPDLIRVEDEWFLAVSPQGLAREEYRNQNIYQSGYFRGIGDYLGEYHLSEFVEWDMGFDFYAPQTFVDEAGRRILIGWAGLPDIEREYSNPTVEEGWQHALTVPRVITKCGSRLYQYPAAELEQLRTTSRKLNPLETVVIPEGIFDLEMKEIKDNSFKIVIAGQMKLMYDSQIFSLKFSGNMGAGRTERKAKIQEVHAVRILCDVSLIEIYINDGEFVFTSRFYRKSEPLTVQVGCKESVNVLWNLKGMEVENEWED